ncbi:MAG: esterase [Verrucomicrobiaceae bacterium]|nr:esterase [Verrucomicrobiaceae bacterium]
MTTFVLLHGGAAGSWIWKYTEEALRARGHNVLTVTFTGFAERRHLCSTTSNVETHVADVVNALEFHDITDAVLVAHSYSGTVAPGVIAAAGDRLRRIIYVDSVIALSGETIVEALGFMPREHALGALAGLRNGTVPIYSPVAEQQRAEAAEKPYRMSAERQEWLLSHLSTMPTAAGVTPVVVGADTVKRQVDYIAVSDTVMKPKMHDRARELGWNVHDVDGDHAIMVGDVETTVKLLEQFSQ